MIRKQTDNWPSKNIFWGIGIFTGLVLLIPFVVMQLSTQVNWTVADFLVMGLLLFAGGSAIAIIGKKVALKYRTLAQIFFIIALLWLWAELAVGVFTSWGS